MHTLLEREAVLAKLDRSARHAARGNGSLVLLRGEAGVGKTAVIAQFIGRLGRRLRVLRGWCDPLTAPRPLGPLIDMLAGLDGPRATRLRAAIDAGDSETIYTGLLGLFGADATWVWVIEDAHWADGATLDLLRFLGRRVTSLPLLLIVSYRDDELGEQHPLAAALGDLATCAGVTRIGLNPLSRDAVVMLCADSGVNADELHRLTGGNPFYVTEVLAAGQDALGGGALPRSVYEAVWGRLARLSPSARYTAHAVAVCGPRANRSLVESVCPAAAGALGECLDARILFGDGDMVAFRHELARRAALEQITDYQRRVLHARALTALAEPPIDPDSLAALAFHAEQAGDEQAVIRYGPAAAERAAELGAHREAAELYGLVLSHAGTISERQRTEWLERHAFTNYLCGSADKAADSWREAIARRRALGDALDEGEDLRWLAHVLWPMGHTTEATRTELASLRILEQLEPGPQLAWSLVTAAELATLGFDPAATIYAERAITLGTQLGEPLVVRRARGYAAMATVLRTDTGWDELEAAWQETMLTEARGEHAGLMGVLMCWIAARHRGPDRAERYMSEASAFCRDRNLGMFQAFLSGIDALLALHRGNWDHATASAYDVLTRPGLPALHRIIPLTTVALTRARRGESQPVAALLDDALADAEPDLFRHGIVWAARAEAAWLAGEDDAARAEVRTGLAAAPAGADPWLVGHLQRWAYLSGDPETPIRTDPMTLYHKEISGDWSAAAREWTRRGFPYDAALAQLGGDIPAVETALATFRRLGARAAARRAQQRLKHMRGHVAPSQHTDPHGLTRRQRDIVELLAVGHSDAEIAAALGISPRTVGSHISAILTKLGLRNRTQAAAYARHEPPVAQGNSL